MRRTGPCQAPLLGDPAVLTERLAQLSSPAALTVGLLSRRHLALPTANAMVKSRAHGRTPAIDAIRPAMAVTFSNLWRRESSALNGRVRPSGPWLHVTYVYMAVADFWPPGHCPEGPI